MSTRQDWYNELERSAVGSINYAKRKANSFDCGIWELPNGKYIALQQGPPVPRGSILIATRTVPGGRWHGISVEEYERRAERAACTAEEAESR